MKACPSRSLSAYGISTPMRRRCLSCCAREADGTSSVAITPARSVMTSRRFMLAPEFRRVS